MKYVSLFSGAGGMDLGADRAGWECVAQVEDDKNCQRVLAHHWPDVPKWGDIADVDGAELPPADAVIFGSPCQDLSVAGRRAGLHGEASSLFFQAIRVIREMQDAGNAPTWVVWENVAGALSSHQGQDFAIVLHELADAGALVLEWAVLDARWFGVPQRRRRVFLVACFDPRVAERCPDPLLPVGPRVRRDTGQSDPTGEDVAGTLGGGSGSRGWAPDTDRMTFVPTHTGTVTANWSKGAGNTQVEEGHVIPFVKAKRAQTNTDHKSWVESDFDRPAPTLNAMDNTSESRATVVTAIHLTQDPITSTEVTPALSLGSKNGSAMVGVATDLAVRRLTPRECERLMGWPDDHTLVPNPRGKPMADSNRYKMCGNGVASPVMTWVAEQINNATAAI